MKAHNNPNCQCGECIGYEEARSDILAHLKARREFLLKLWPDEGSRPVDRVDELRVMIEQIERGARP